MPDTYGVLSNEPNATPAEKLPSIYRIPVPGSVQGPTDRLLSGAKHTQQAESL